MFYLGFDPIVDDDDRSSFDDKQRDGSPCGNGSSGRDVVSSYVANDMSSKNEIKLFKFSSMVIEVHSSIQMTKISFINGRLRDVLFLMRR